MKDPGSVNELQRRIGRAASARQTTVKRLQSIVANTALCQVLPDSAVKGGTGLKLRFGEQLTRETPDLDTAFRGNREEFLAELADNLRAGWGPFTGTAVEGPQRQPAGLDLPLSYVMQPITVKLLFHRKPFATIKVEVGYDELQATTNEEPELHLAGDLVDLFADLGLPTPQPVRVLPLPHQIAQKLHACTEPGNERAHDLVDLQLTAPRTDPAVVAAVTRRLFRFRNQHPWPTHVTPGPSWETLYTEAALGLAVHQDLAAATDWANAYIDTLEGQPDA